MKPTTKKPRKGRKIKKVLIFFLVSTGFFRFAVPQNNEINNKVSPQKHDEIGIEVLLRVNGTLEYLETNGNEWKTAKIGQCFCNGFQVRTLTGNKAIIVFSSGMRILINENTKLEIASHTLAKFQKSTTEVTTILAGDIYLKLNPMKDRLHNCKLENSSSVESFLG